MRGQRDATGRAYDQGASLRCGFMNLMTAGKVSGQNRARSGGPGMTCRWLARWRLSWLVRPAGKLVIFAARAGTLDVDQWLALGNGVDGSIA